MIKRIKRADFAARPYVITGETMPASTSITGETILALTICAPALVGSRFFEGVLCYEI